MLFCLFLANPYVRVYAVYKYAKNPQHLNIIQNNATKKKKGPEGSVDKPFLWTEGRVSLRAALNKSAYGHGEHISVTIDVRNDSRKIIRKIRVSVMKSARVAASNIYLSKCLLVLN